MSRNKKRKGKKTNILLGFICIILVGVLGTILVMSYNTEQEEAKRLTELAGNQQSGIEDYEAVKEHAAQLEKLSSEIIVKQKVGQHPHINVTDKE